MIFDITFFALAVPAVLLAGVSKGGFGSGAAFAATPILALVIDPALSVGLMLPLLMLIDVATLRPYWKRWSWPHARRLIVGSLPGVALGVLFWQIANADVLRFLIGAIALGFVAFQIARGRGWLTVRARGDAPVLGLVAGALSGFTSFISHAGGPPAAVYLLSQGLSKTQYQATTVLTFFTVNLLKAPPYAFLGIFSTDTLRAGLYLAPVALLGAWLGVKAHWLIPERAYFAVTYTLLTLTGAKLIFDALT
jgi:hypothetical protein